MARFEHTIAQVPVSFLQSIGKSNARDPSADDDDIVVEPPGIATDNHSVQKSSFRYQELSICCSAAK